MRYFVAAVLMVLLLTGCGGPASTPTPVPTPTVPPPTATPIVGKLGQTVETTYYDLTLNNVSYVESGNVPPGQRLVIIDITITAKRDGVPYNPTYATVRMSDNTDGQMWLTGYTPLLQAGRLQSGEKVRGVIPFGYVYTGSPKTLIYEPILPGAAGSLRATFELR